MATDKELMKAFQEQFNTGRVFTESQVLVLMGYARGEEWKQKSDQPKVIGESKIVICFATKNPCPYVDKNGYSIKICNDCDLIH